jgi:hypothetical protein
MSFTENVKIFLSWGSNVKRHISIGVFVVYIDTGSSMPISPSKSRDLADENNFFFDGIEMIRNNRSVHSK